MLNLIPSALCGSRTGTSACFVIDAGSYLVAAFCAHQLRGVTFLPQPVDPVSCKGCEDAAKLVAACCLVLVTRAHAIARMAAVHAHRFDGQ